MTFDSAAVGYFSLCILYVICNVHVFHIKKLGTMSFVHLNVCKFVSVKIEICQHDERANQIYSNVS